MRFYFFIIILFICDILRAADQPPTPKEAARVIAIYNQVLHEIGWDREELKGKFSNIPAAKNVEEYLDTSEGRANPRDLMLRGPLSIFVNSDSFEIHVIANSALDNYLTEHKDQRQVGPALTVEQALGVAKAYMDKLGAKVPSDCKLGEISFGSPFRSAWKVSWKRFAQNYPYDEFMAPYIESVGVIFHEHLGLIAYSTRITTPAPKSLDVKVSREEAIVKASKVAPLVMRTPFFKQRRDPEYIVSGLKEATLKVAVPNWLLDPKRAEYFRDKPPAETRLCWVITFDTMDIKAAERSPDRAGKPLVPPAIILIYIDAATGEAVGANFS